MKLEYNILWIDNDIQEYVDNGEVGSMNSFLEDLGFEPNIITLADEAQLDEYIFLHKYDLIVSDFNLNATTGDVIIEKIRNMGLSSEILFYTAKSNFRDDPNVKDRLAFMDRIIFHSGRETFIAKVEKVITLTLDKLLELNATRGLITATTSYLDVEIETLVTQLINQIGLTEENLKEIIQVKIVAPLDTKLKTFWEKYEDFGSYFHRIDALQKWKILRDLLKTQTQTEEITAFLIANKTYQAEVIEIRNKFAHAKEEESEGKTVLKGQLGKEDFQFDVNACIDIRRKLISHKQNILTLKATLFPN